MSPHSPTAAAWWHPECTLSREPALLVTGQPEICTHNGYSRNEKNGGYITYVRSTIMYTNITIARFFIQCLPFSALLDNQRDTSLSAICAAAAAKGWSGCSTTVSRNLKLYSCTNQTPSQPATRYTGAHPLTCSPALVCPVCAEAPRSLRCSSSPPPPIDGQIPFSYDGCPWQQSVKEEATTLSAWPTASKGSHTHRCPSSKTSLAATPPFTNFPHSPIRTHVYVRTSLQHGRV